MGPGHCEENGSWLGPKKGQEAFKGKSQAKKAMPKSPAIATSESEDEGEKEDQQVILDQIVALERAWGFPQGDGQGPELLEEGRQDNPLIKDSRSKCAVVFLF